MATICPTVLAKEAHQYREQMERIAPFAHRIQIDLTDGIFAPVKTVGIDQVWWPVGVQADLHIMFQKPEHALKAIIDLEPRLVIVHAEAQGNFFTIAQTLKDSGIQVGIAILPKTEVTVIEPVLNSVDHVLIFSGDLGKFGGRANMDLLAKAARIKKIDSSIEIGWDGGVNPENAKQLSNGGIDILNVGGYIQQAEEPQTAFESLRRLVA